MQVLNPRVTRVALAASLLIGGASVHAQSTKPADPASRESKDAAVDAAAKLSVKIPELKLDNIPLTDVIDALRDLTAADLTVNHATLEAAGIRQNTPVTMRGNDKTLGQVLDDLFPLLGRDDIRRQADKGSILISTKKDLEQLASFRERNAAQLGAEAMTKAAPNLDFELPPARLKEVLAKLSNNTGVTIRADADALAKAGVPMRRSIRARLRNLTLGEALTRALWLTGRIDQLDLQVDGDTITIVHREKAKAA